MKSNELEIIDERISEAERLLTWLYEQRREYINQHNLNKVNDEQAN
jgi:hypothetical protein